LCRKEKKRVEKELLSTFKDESIIVMADWLKVNSPLGPLLEKITETSGLKLPLLSVLYCIVYGK
jgi:hypothetical protein